jgi:TPR repeat protein
MHIASMRFALCFCVLLAAGCSTLSLQDQKETFDQGVALYDAGKYEDAYQVFDDLASVDAAAARNAGLMLRKGQGVEKNPDAAKRMFAFAAQGGLATAAADLGEMLLLGEGAPPNPKAALPWLQMAATAHHTIAEYHLGQMYEEGNGVPRDIGQAKLLYADAASAGMEEAVARLKSLGGDPPPLRSTTTDDKVGPSRKGRALDYAPAPEETSSPEAAPASAPSPDDDQDISKPNLSTPGLPGTDGSSQDDVLQDAPSKPPSSDAP